jgi:hypothetical protein
MDQELREALRRAVEASAGIVLNNARLRTLAVVRGTTIVPEERIELEFGYAHLRGAIASELEQFDRALAARHRELVGAQLGAATIGWSPFHPRDLVVAVLRDFARRDPRLAFDASAFERAVSAFDDFVVRPIAHLRTIAPVIGLDFRGADALLGRSRLHALTDTERTDLLNRGALDALDAMNVICAIVVDWDEDAIHAEGRDPPPRLDRDVIEQSLRMLRTFKGGTIWVRHLDHGVTGFWPANRPLAIGTVLDRALVTARCTIGAGEEGALAEHAGFLARRLEPSLELACSRLADAETRTQPRDALLDAAIGLEAILLHEASADHRYKGETRYRFAMHYAALSPPAERERAFHLARDLYDARSAVAYGSADELFRLDGKKVPLSQVADRAKATLREVVRVFLPSADHPAYVTEGYWTSRLFETSPPSL